MEYLYLHTAIEDVYGHSCACLIPNLENPSFTTDPSETRFDGSLKMYISISHFAAGNRAVDNFKFSYLISDEFIDSMSSLTATGKILEAILRKCIESVPDADGAETNLLPGNVGAAGFQSAVVVSG